MQRMSSLLGPVYTKRQRQHSQRCHIASDVDLIEKNGVTLNGLQPYGSTLFISIDFNESYVASVIAVFTLALGANGPLRVWQSWCEIHTD